jgi:hypothetical protein
VEKAAKALDLKNNSKKIKHLQQKVGKVLA